MRALGALIASALAVGTPGIAYGAACCGGISSADAFILPKANRATAGVAVSFEDDVATVSSSGKVVGLRSWESRDVRLVVGGVVRLSPTVQAGISAPLVARSVTVVDATGLAAGVGDLRLQARWELHDDDTCYLNRSQPSTRVEPSVHVVARATLPTGRYRPDDGDLTGASQLGRGYAIGDLGVEATKVWGVLGANLSATGGWMTPASGFAGGRDAARLSAGFGVNAFYRYKSFVGVAVSHRAELGAEGARVDSTDVSLHLAHYDLRHNLRWLVGIGALGAPPSRSTPVGWQAGASLSRVF